MTHITHTLLMNHLRNYVFNHINTKPTRWEESELVMWSNERDSSVTDVNPHATLEISLTQHYIHQPLEMLQQENIYILHFI